MIKFFVFCIFFVNISFVALSDKIKFKDLIIQDCWIQMLKSNQKNASGYFKIKNNSSIRETLISVSSKISFRTELHEMKVENNIMKMKKLSKGLFIPAKEEVLLKPGGIHIMLLDLKNEIKLNERYEITMNFKRSGKINIPFKVKKILKTTNMHSH